MSIGFPKQDCKSAAGGRLIFVLGSLTALSPFAIDMYLPAFQLIAADFGTSVSEVSLSISSYFVGLSVGQLFYGPVLDRFGRKKPLYFGLSLFVMASLLCVFATSASALAVWRFAQAIGGCAAGVASMAMVRDLFSVRESARVYSLLILVLGVSPLLAPTLGGAMAVAFGWHSIFLILGTMGLVLLLAVRFLLPETHLPDPSVSLAPQPILNNFWAILLHPQFYTYVFSGAISFAGLFVYLAGSPVIFLDGFKVGSQVYSLIFAIVSVGFIGASQLNVLFLRRLTNEQLVRTGITAQVIIGWIFLTIVYLDWVNLPITVAMFFLFLSSFGLTNPNAGALALAPFSKNAGRAAALMGFFQMGIGALMSSLVGLLGVTQLLSVVAIMASGSTAALLTLAWGRGQIKKQVPSSRLSEPVIL